MTYYNDVKCCTTAYYIQISWYLVQMIVLERREQQREKRSKTAKNNITELVW